MSATSIGPSSAGCPLRPEEGAGLRHECGASPDRPSNVGRVYGVLPGLVSLRRTLMAFDSWNPLSRFRCFRQPRPHGFRSGIGGASRESGKQPAAVVWGASASSCEANCLFVASSPSSSRRFFEASLTVDECTRMRCYFLLSHLQSCPTPVTPRPALSCPFLSCGDPSYPVVCPVLTCPAMPCPTFSRSSWRCTQVRIREGPRSSKVRVQSACVGQQICCHLVLPVRIKHGSHVPTPWALPCPTVVRAAPFWSRTQKRAERGEREGREKGQRDGQTGRQVTPRFPSMQPSTARCPSQRG